MYGAMTEHLKVIEMSCKTHHLKQFQDLKIEYLTHYSLSLFRLQCEWFFLIPYNPCFLNQLVPVPFLEKCQGWIHHETWNKCVIWFYVEPWGHSRHLNIDMGHHILSPIVLHTVPIPVAVPDTASLITPLASHAKYLKRSAMVSHSWWAPTRTCVCFSRTCIWAGDAAFVRVRKNAAEVQVEEDKSSVKQELLQQLKIRLQQEKFVVQVLSCGIRTSEYQRKMPGKVPTYRQELFAPDGEFFPIDCSLTCPLG